MGILTVRDDEHVWLNSWKNFARVFYNNGGVFSRRIMTFIMQSGMCGYRNRRFVSLAAHYLHHLVGSPFASIDELPTSISPIEVAGALPGKDLKRKYIEHNRHVMETVPKDRLLVWNLKDGWKPLCDFLNLPIPNVPVPRVNETSDKNFFAFYFWERLSPCRKFQFYGALVFFVIMIFLIPALLLTLFVCMVTVM